jgi:hypothetical protein
MTSRRVLLALAAVAALAACGDDDDAPDAAPTTDSPPVASSAATSGPSDTAPTSDTPLTTGGSGGGTRCLVRLHGKGGSGSDTVVDGEVTVISPTGNSEGWGARQWLYFPEDEYAAARQIVADSVDGCGQIIVNGFSNGASFAAALYCQGETFDGRLVGVVIDDPVPDHAVDGCAPDPAVAVTLYSTGALDATATPGWSCSEGDWTCAGGETIGIEAYAEALGTAILESPFDVHQWYVDAPETTAWQT